MHLLGPTLAHTWEPFALVVGLLLIGHAAAREGLFEFLGHHCARLPGGQRTLFVATMVAVALVTAVLNLDTSVVFMTPVILHAARSRKADETAFLYGAIFMANAASLLLLGSNLTNMLVVASQPVRGGVFAQRMVLPWVVAVALTIVMVGLWRRRELRGPGGFADVARDRVTFGVGVAAAVGAVGVMLVSTHPAAWVLGTGVVVEGVEVVRRRVRIRESVAVANPLVVVPLFILAVLVGWLGRSWGGATHLVAHSGTLVTALVGAGAALLINNLPAASLFAGRHLAHPYALLLGLDLGPNAFVTGAMSTMLWLRVARANGASPSVTVAARVGVVVTVITIVASAAVL
jgi:arsenical pump membrane protein